MDSFIARKKRRISCSDDKGLSPPNHDDESTDMKLAILASLNPHMSQEFILDVLLSCDGSVESATKVLSSHSAEDDAEPKRKISAIGMQSALSFPNSSKPSELEKHSPVKKLSKKGRTLFLYRPKDIADHTPCSIVHNFLPPDLARELLLELLPETETYESISFKLFDNVVKSPHTACFYVDSLAEREKQRNEYLYNGSNLDDVREILPVMRKVSQHVKEVTNAEIEGRIRDYYPNGQKLRYQTPKEWQPNAAFVNCYDGAAQSVGYHSDQLTYVGPRSVIASLSLGVAREFRVRRIVAKEDDDGGEAADAQGQISIHLPHNSLLVMHAEMQEEWKHSIAPAQAIDPHPVAGNKRINITYRWYRPEYKPQFTPKCKCGTPTVLKTVQRQKLNRGRYMWMCQTPGRPDGGNGCGHFEWAAFTDDGDPIWKHKDKAKATLP